MRSLLASAFLLVAAGTILRSPGAGEPPDLDVLVRAFLHEPDEDARRALAGAIVESRARVRDVASALEGWQPDEELTPVGRSSFRGPAPGAENGLVHLHVPVGPAPPTGWPTLLWLHGDLASLREDAGREALDLLQEASVRDGFVIVAPSADRTHPWWSRAGERRVLEALAEAKRRVFLDPDRVALAGRSDGGSACFHFLAHQPDPFCAFFAFVGNPRVATRLGGPRWNGAPDGRPVYVVSGGRDPLYPAAGMRALIEELEAEGTTVQFVVEEEAGHDLSFLPRRWPEILEFWRAHPRGPVPHSLQWTTSRPGGERRAWIEITGLDPSTAQGEGIEPPPGLAPDPDRGYGRPPATVHAMALPEGRIEIETEGVGALRLHLHPDVVDLDRELVVVLDGREIYRGAPPVDTLHLLEEARREGPGARPAWGALDLDARETTNSGVDSGGSGD